MVILSVDYGDARTGVAVCDKNEMLASPVTVINEKNTERLVNAIIETASQKNAELIVVGLPKNMDGSEGFRAEACRDFASQLSDKSGVEVRFQDRERLTTVSAHNYLNETNTRGKKRKAIIDAVSAVIILEDYMKKTKNK